ncbi:ABC-F family ATP-binding cassette domain-containing protein [Sporolactobacillus sp. THM7-7]|nr:ABC-F family ATP-binding cassette domain-containing protein [Sporolactobacillus sp. THM7-7]
MLLIEAKHVSFSYGDKPIYQDINFRLMEGEHIVLVGKNGAGKSTFLKLLTGELLPDSGTVTKREALTIGVIEQRPHVGERETIYSFLQNAFQELFDAERKMNELAEKMADPHCPETVMDTYGRLQDFLMARDFYAIDAKIRELADGLGLSAIGLDAPARRLSGGQLTKLCLARLLLERQDMLLLDEPTNYLDTNHIDWLSSYLKTYPHAFLVISHDTSFLNRIAEQVYHLENRKLVRYVGNYQSFLGQHEARVEQQSIAFRQQQREIKKLETYVQKNKARSATARLAKSREKRLEKMERIDPPVQARKPRFHFKIGREPVRLIFSLKQVCIGYDRPLLPPIDLRVERGEKVAVVGHNGIGKTTLLRTILGELPPISGKIIIGDHVNPGYFAQISLPPSLTPLEWMMEQFPNIPVGELRRHLAQCGVLAEHTARPMNALSGGEETKVRIARLMMQKSNVLIFDEPTNHLDVDAKAALSAALEAYPGTILVVSHERRFYESWATRIWDVAAWSEKV